MQGSECQMWGRTAKTSCCSRQAGALRVLPRRSGRPADTSERSCRRMRRRGRQMWDRTATTSRSSRPARALRACAASCRLSSTLHPLQVHACLAHCAWELGQPFRQLAQQSVQACTDLQGCAHGPATIPFQIAAKPACAARCICCIWLPTLLLKSEPRSTVHQQGV